MLANYSECAKLILPIIDGELRKVGRWRDLLFAILSLNAAMSQLETFPSKLLASGCQLNPEPHALQIKGFPSLLFLRLFPVENTTIQLGIHSSICYCS